MTTHAERVREAERAVNEAAEAVELASREPGIGLHVAIERLCERVRALLALRAAACPTCGGEGDTLSAVGDCGVRMDPCPAGCEAGKRRDA